MFLLDTNVISELVRLAPDAGVRAYVRRLPPDEVFTSAICEAELRYGLARMPTGLRRTQLAQRIDVMLMTVFNSSILPFDTSCAETYGDIRAQSQSMGNSIDLADAMIAAVAHVHGAALVTRNVKHFAHCGVAVIDPWQAQP